MVKRTCPLDVTPTDPAAPAQSRIRVLSDPYGGFPRSRERQSVFDYQLDVVAAGAVPAMRRSKVGRPAGITPGTNGTG